RDPRLYGPIAYSGAVWELSGVAGRRQWTYTGAESNNPTPGGFYTRKAVNPEDDAFEAFNGHTQWIEIRFSEVLMNLAEAANAIGNTQVAYDQIIALRARAGIDPGTGLYGLDPNMSGAQLQDAIMLERQIEFAYDATPRVPRRHARRPRARPLAAGTRRHHPRHQPQRRHRPGAAARRRRAADLQRHLPRPARDRVVATRHPRRRCRSRAGDRRG